MKRGAEERRRVSEPMRANKTRRVSEPMRANKRRRDKETKSQG